MEKSNNILNKINLLFQNSNNNKFNNITNIKYYSKKIPNQPEEKYYGNREYKRFILFNDKKENKRKLKINKRSTQLLFRLSEGEGKALYIIGLEDDGIVYGIEEHILIESINNIIEMCNIIKAEIKNINIYNGINGYISSIRIIKIM
tara:strand:- start:57 stop:497 length:441 start_codon:yes stop_codon:yes gene_type:complete